MKLQHSSIQILSPHSLERTIQRLKNLEQKSSAPWDYYSVAISPLSDTSASLSISRIEGKGIPVHIEGTLERQEDGTTLIVARHIVGGMFYCTMVTWILPTTAYLCLYLTLESATRLGAGGVISLFIALAAYQVYMFSRRHQKLEDFMQNAIFS